MNARIQGAFIAIAIAALIVAGTAAPASAADNVVADAPLPAPAADGTNGANDGPAVINLPTTTFAAPSGLGTKGLVQPLAGTACDANSVWYTVVSPSKSGAVTTWSKHIKNDATPETFTWSSSTAVTLTANMSTSGTLSASVGIEKLAAASLGITSNFGLQTQVASTASYSRTVSFSSAGSWIIWAGVYKGTGSVKQYKCASNGQSSSVVGSGSSGVTFNKARVTGLTNCANSVSDLVEVNAKLRC